MENNHRDKLVQVLGFYLSKPGNIKILEQAIFNACEDNEEMYVELGYQVIGDILSGEKLTNVLSLIKNNKILWNHPYFDECRQRIEEQDNFLENPIEIAEGVLECTAFDKKKGGVCGSKRVFSFAVQDRSCDEGTSVRATCMVCGNRWIHKG